METAISPEHAVGIKPRSSIRLEFFRHSEKDSAASGQHDYTVRLTQAGRALSSAAGSSLDPHPQVALAYGSPRDRSSETALREMLANNDEIAADDSLEEIRSKIGTKIKVGSKEIITDNLNFNWAGSTEFNRLAYDHYAKKDALKFMFEESDQLVKDLDDKESTSYSRAAANVAAIVERYITIFDPWKKLTQANPEKFAVFNNELQRFLGSHGGTTECFLMKVVEKSEGRDGVLQLIGSLQDPNNQFGINEGFSVRIDEDDNGEKRIAVGFKDRSWTITPQVIREIIEEGRPEDRFQKLSNNYGELFSEVFAEQGMDYQRLQQSVLETVSSTLPNFRDLPILDIGIGDGATSAPFVAAGSTKLTGIDVNEEMVDAARARFGKSVDIRKMNAIDMRAFSRGDFEIILGGAAIHNIARPSRKMFWGEILRLNPRIFVLAEKIKDADPAKHETNYQREVAAIKRVYGEKHGLKEAEEEWLHHYEYDERESLTLAEIKESIGSNYEVSVVNEMGLYKTVLAKRKE